MLHTPAAAVKQAQLAASGSWWLYVWRRESCFTSVGGQTWAHRLKHASRQLAAESAKQSECSQSDRQRSTLGVNTDPYDPIGKLNRPSTSSWPRSPNCSMLVSQRPRIKYFLMSSCGIRLGLWIRIPPLVSIFTYTPPGSPHSQVEPHEVSILA